MNPHIFSCCTCINIKRSMLNDFFSFIWFFLLKNTSKNCLSLLQLCFEQQRAISTVNQAHTIYRLTTLQGYFLQCKYQQQICICKISYCRQNNMKICFHQSLEVALGNPRRPIGIMSERVSTFVNCVLCLSSGSLACTGTEKQPGLVFAVLLSKQSQEACKLLGNKFLFSV